MRRLPVPYRQMTREQKAEYRRQAYLRNPESERRRSRAYQLANPAAHHQRQRDWRAANPDKVHTDNLTRRGPCGLCGRPAYNPLCRRCSDKIRRASSGYLCRGCEIRGRHAHCVCFEPIAHRQTLCDDCERSRVRQGLTVRAYVAREFRREELAA